MDTAGKWLMAQSLESYAEDCCTFEALVKGVMFYPGRERLSTRVFSKVIFERDVENAFHENAYFVKLFNDKGSDGDKLILGHLTRPVAEAVHGFSSIPGVKMLG